MPRNLARRANCNGQTTISRRHEAAAIWPEQNKPRNWTMVSPMLSYRLQGFDDPGVQLSWIRRVLKFDQGE
jgi:hypothetical protein